MDFSSPTPPISSREEPVDPFLGDIMDHPQYAVVLKMVLWGEPREDIDSRLRVNGITGSVAESILVHARAERIRSIRADAFRKILFGSTLSLLAIGVFSVCWVALNFIPNYLLYFCIVGLGVGAWKTIDGTAAWFMASSKTGPVADDH